MYWLADRRIVVSLIALACRESEGTAGKGYERDYPLPTHLEDKPARTRWRVGQYGAAFGRLLRL